LYSLYKQWPLVNDLGPKEVSMKVGDKFALGPVSYEIVNEEKAGGFAVVSKAVATDPFESSLAVKVLQPQFASDPEWEKRFEREARILANIDHVNVVKIRATMPLADGSLAILQEYVEGARDMREFFKTHNESEKLSVVLQVLYGLRATHGIAPAAGAIHRDLSPYNILIDPKGVAKIIDFGLAKMTPRDSAVLSLTPGMYFGTAGCIAPEQMNDVANADHRSDLFALGRSIAASSQDREPQHADCAALPEPWRTICLQLSNHDPNARHSDSTLAIEHFLSSFLAAGILPADFNTHLAEYADWDATPDSWPAIVRTYVNGSFGSRYDLYQSLCLIGSNTFTRPSFEIDEIFMRAENEAFEPIFGTRTASFDATDGLGDLVVSWLPRLNQTTKVVAFRRLIRTAVDYNRYHVMHLVRAAYSNEPNQTIKNLFLGLLASEDSTVVIEGRGMIPGR
jgi:serine/threonine protein kinase